MKKKIGFYIPDEDDNKPEIPDSSEIVLRKFISANYDTNGAIEQKEFRSTLELQYELRESVDVSIPTINRILTEMDYDLDYIEGMPNWVMYKK